MSLPHIPGLDIPQLDICRLVGMRVAMYACGYVCVWLCMRAFTTGGISG